MSIEWYGLVGGEVIGPFKTMDLWYQRHAGPDWRMKEFQRSGNDPWLVARDHLPDGREVSTVFLGLNHAWMPDEPPRLFETMIFPEAHLVGRCATLEGAKAMHAMALHEYSH